MLFAYCVKMYVNLYANGTIMRQRVTTDIILDTRREKKDGTYPVKLRVTFQRKQKYYNVGLDLIESDFEKARGEKPRGNHKENRLEMDAAERKAVDAISQLEPFSFDRFESLIRIPSASRNSVYAAFERTIEDLTEKGRIGTAQSYKEARSSLMKYRKKLLFTDVTVSFLEGYEHWMKDENKRSLTTVGIYLRALRAILNAARTEGLTNAEYPFGKNKYQIPSGVNVKKALRMSDIEKIYHYEPATPNEEYARDMWVFSYLCNGINMKDLANLKFSNINGQTMEWVREKTARSTRQNQKRIVAILTPELVAIINRWGNESKNPDHYIFPILAKTISPESKQKRVKQFTKTVNKYIGIIAEELGIEQKVTTYTARHSYSTVLKRSGASIEFISESLGHNDLKTTENYLDSFEIELKVEHAKKLTAFNSLAS